MSFSVLLRWNLDALEPLDYCEPRDYSIEVADSWLVSEGQAFALGVHRTRFFESVAHRGFSDLLLEQFWERVLTEIPRTGDWFPRVELQSRDGAPSLWFRHRSAPKLVKSVTVVTHQGDDPRTAATVKGPDLLAMSLLKTSAQKAGADEPIILTPDGYVVEGATTALAWWRGSILCTPPAAGIGEEFARINSITARTLLALADALGCETAEEAATPAELAGTEVWALNSLHGIRIITQWVDGPAVAEEPGRLALWRSRRQALFSSLPERQVDRTAT